MTEVNKVIYGSDVLIDLTSDTVTSELLAAGETAHDASGKKIVGSATFKSGIPNGGTIGQVLAKISDTDGDAGWFDIHKLPNNKWYLPEGILEDQVIAAYQFVGRGSEAEALININEGTKYSLTENGTVTWNSETGFYLPAENSNGFSQTVLNNLYSNAKTGAFGFNGVSSGTGIYGGILMNVARTLMVNTVTSGGTVTGNYHAGMSVSNTSGNVYLNTDVVSAGVMAAEWNSSPKLYVNGISVSLASSGAFGAAVSGNSITLGHINRPDSNNRNIYFTAFVLYDTYLTAAQHMELSDNIRALGGILT